MSKANDRHVIWSDLNLDIDDWRDDYREYCENNNIEYNPNDENAIYDYMYETNNPSLDDERANLDIQLSQPIIVIGDLGRWNGRTMGYREIGSGNIKDCLYSDISGQSSAEWYIDKQGDLRAEVAHHDGTNYYLYRVYKDNLSQEQIDNFKDKIYRGKATRSDITRYTRRLGDEIAPMYGWEIPKQKKDVEPER